MQLQLSKCSTSGSLIALLSPVGIESLLEDTLWGTLGALSFGTVEPGEGGQVLLFWILSERGELASVSSDTAGCVHGGV
jgi:hypothetical protein